MRARRTTSSSPTPGCTMRRFVSSMEQLPPCRADTLVRALGTQPWGRSRREGRDDALLAIAMHRVHPLDVLQDAGAREPERPLVYHVLDDLMCHEVGLDHADVVGQNRVLASGAECIGSQLQARIAVAVRRTELPVDHGHVARPVGIGEVHLPVDSDRERWDAQMVLDEGSRRGTSAAEWLELWSAGERPDRLNEAGLPLRVQRLRVWLPGDSLPQ